LGPEKYFFEIPIYRVTQKRFNDDYERDLARWFRSGPDPASLPEHLRMSLEQHFWDTYGGPWRFNQVVGWLRLYVLGHQIRGELWMSASKRFTRNGRRRFRHVGKAFEMHCGKRQSPDEIRSEIQDELLRFRREHRRLHLDLECFDRLAPTVDWNRLVFG